MLIIDAFKPDISFDDANNSWVHKKNGDEVDSSQIAFNHPQSDLSPKIPFEAKKNISNPDKGEDITIAMDSRDKPPAEITKMSHKMYLNHNKKFVSEAQLKAISNGLKMNYFEWISEQQQVIFDNIPKPQLVIDADLGLKDKRFIEFKRWRESHEGNEEELADLIEA